MLVVEEVRGQGLTEVCLAVRAGPDRLPYSTFRYAPRPIRAVAYWYRDHAACADEACRCRHADLAGDGLCVVAFKDGPTAILSLAHPPGQMPLTWRARNPDPSRAECTPGEAPGPWDGFVGPEEALSGLLAALELARERGLFQR